jgi:hypothetical protein
MTICEFLFQTEATGRQSWTMLLIFKRPALQFASNLWKYLLCFVAYVKYNCMMTAVMYSGFTKSTSLVPLSSLPASASAA